KVSCLKQYFKKNRYRMDYAQYLAKGWCIGSGAIESAHRTLIQERMKLSGQRWGTNAQPLIKLRVAYASDKEHIVNQLFRSAA
ncbi:MAG: ISKra4 family transposase, partial [Bernardetiaceae bacterium]|nr:ISKra4 family transposase [Bernardetiaceae bacterium]